jgi:hypothetical protein
LDCGGAWDWSGGGEGLRIEADRNMSCHGGVGDEFDEVEFLESGSLLYGTNSIFQFERERECLCLWVCCKKLNLGVGKASSNIGLTD